MEPGAEDKVKRKFDIAYWLVKENLAFSKMASFCDMEVRHGVDLGSGYKNNQACSTFVHYYSQRAERLSTICSSQVEVFQHSG